MFMAKHAKDLAQIKAGLDELGSAHSRVTVVSSNESWI